MFSKKLLATSVSAVTLALAGCGASDQDTGSSSNNVQLSGLVVDPYVAQAKVYIDLNNNGVHEYGSFEAFAFTDEDGYFSSDKDGNSYCDESAATYNKRHCLDTRQLSDDAVLRIEGGFDVATGEKFKGSIALPLDLNSASGITSTGVVNPLTSYLVAIQNFSPEDKTRALALVGYDSADWSSEDDFVASLKQDFMDFEVDADDPVGDAQRFKTAIKIHKAVTILSRGLEEQYSEWMGEKVGDDDTLMPSSASKFVYESLARRHANGGFAATQNGWSAVLSDAEDTLVKVYEDASGETATQLATSVVEGLGKRASSIYTWLNSVSVVSLDKSNVSSEDNKLAAKSAIERLARAADLTVGLVDKELKDISSISTTTSKAEDFIANTPAADLTSKIMTLTPDDTDSVVANLSESADLSGAVDSISSGGDANVSSITVFSKTSASKLFSDASTLAGNSLRLDYTDTMDTEVTTDDERSAVKLFFVGSTGDTQGTLKACIKTESSEDENASDVEEISGEGAYIEGRWSRLTDYSVTVSITKPVSPEDSLIVKSSTVSADKYSFSLDSGSDAESWDGSLAPYSVSDLPSTDDDCKTLF